MRSSTRAALLAALALLLLAAAWAQVRLEARRPVDSLEDAQLYVKSSKALDRMVLSYDAFVADIYWMRAIQHFGGQRRSQSEVKRYDLLYPLLDLTTSLDPYFTAAYYFGSFFLAEPLPGGAGRPDLAITLLERGMQYEPRSWRYPHQIGFINYWYVHNYAEAAKWFRRAAELPDVPEWITALEATTRAEGGDLATSRRIWQQIIETAESDWMRETARFRLMQVDAFAAIDELEQITGSFAARYGRAPANWGDVVRAGLIAGIPLDPTGVPFVLDDAGKVNVSSQSQLYPLPDRPRGF